MGAGGFCKMGKIGDWLIESIAGERSKYVILNADSSMRESYPAFSEEGYFPVPTRREFA